MISRLIVAALSFAALTGCVQNYAEREIVQGAPAGSLVVLNAPQGATIIVNGQFHGTVGHSTANLTPGRHEVVIEAAGRRIHAQSVFVAAGSRVEVRVP